MRAVQDVSFEVRDREFVAIVGPSGCGKSTILNMIGGLVSPTAGRIEIDGRPVAGVPPGVGYVFQKDTVFPWRTVRRNIALGLEYRGVRGPELERRVRERTAELLRVNAALAVAKAKADEANLDKTRFLAAASHDILQPLNAARLYATSLVERKGEGVDAKLATNIDASLEAVEEIRASPGSSAIACSNWAESTGRA